MANEFSLINMHFALVRFSTASAFQYAIQILERITLEISNLHRYTRLLKRAVCRFMKLLIQLLLFR